MRCLSVSILLVIVITTSSGEAEAQSGLAPAGILRAVCLSNNPAQARKDPVTGALRGVAVDLTRELGRRLGVETTMTALGSPQAVIDAVRNGQADIGFVAYNPERAGPVEFSQTYMLVQQTFLVRQDSPIRSVVDIDRPNQKIGAGKGDSIALYLARTLKQAQLIEVTDPGTAAGLDALMAGKLDAFGANRQRLTDAMRERSGLRLLPDDLYGVEQAMIVPKGSSESLKAVNQFIDDVRRSGFLRAAIEQSGIVGIAVAEPVVR